MVQIAVNYCLPTQMNFGTDIGIQSQDETDVD